MASVGDKLKALVEWAPALSMLSEISAADSVQERVAGALKLIRFLATKTDTKVDDDLLERIEACLLSPQGQELFSYVVALLTAVAKTEVPE